MKKNKTVPHLIILLSLIIIGLIINLIVNNAFNKFEDEINDDLSNITTQTEIGAIVLNNLLKIELETLNITKATSTHALDFHFNKSKILISRINGSLKVLQDGGNLNYTLKLNVKNNNRGDNIKRSLSYKSNKNERYTQSLIDLQTKLVILKRDILKIKILCLEKLTEKNSIKEKNILEDELTMRKKIILPLFKRMREHANQIVYEGAKEKEITIITAKDTRKLYSKTERTIILSTIILLLTLGILISRQIVKDNEKFITASTNIDTILQSLPVGILLIDPDTVICGINKEAQSILKITSQKDCLGLNYDDVIKPIKKDNIDHNDSTRSTNYFSKDIQIKNFDGKIITILKTCIPLELNGTPMLLESFMDISKLKKVEYNLELSANRWRDTFDAMQDMIAVINKKMVIISCNKAMKDRFPTVIEGETTCHSVVHSLCHPSNGCVALETFKTGKPTRRDIFEEHLGNIWLDTRTFPVFNGDGEVDQVIHTFRDITELKNYENKIIAEKEKAEAASEAKSTFLSMMSHEIRTPMNGVIGMTDLLSETKLNKEQKDYVHTIQISGDALLTVINDILDYSKIESGKLELESKPFELSKILEDAIDLMNIKALEKNLKLFYIIDKKVPNFIYGDTVRLRQIIINLVGNALKFTQKGEVLISVEVAPDSKKDRDYVKLSFSVKDSGIGISKEGQERLFKNFSQVDSSTTRKYGGTGLGLAICKRLTKMMGGNITISSELGKGSTFTFTIETKIAPKEQREYLKHSVPKLNNANILIVDDNPTNRKILKIQTENWGMNPYLANSADEALHILTDDKEIDIAIIDMQMPEMNGDELAKEIRKQFPKKNLSLIMLSSMGETCTNNIKSGLFAAYLNKPAKQSELFDTLINLYDDGTNSLEDVQVANKEESKKEDIIDFSHLKVLVAEDNPINRKLASKLFEKLGATATFAENGKLAVDMIENDKFDLMFMDCQMPIMDGYEATKQIRKLNCKQSSIPIIAMTANAMKGDKEKCLDAGMDDYISKPIKRQKIVDTIIEWTKS